MTTLALNLLGPFQASLAAEPLGDFRTRKVQALLIYLAAEPDAHSREELLDLFWSGLPEKSARSNLRQILYYLRQALPGTTGKDRKMVPVVIANRQEIQLNPQANVYVDATRLEARLDGVHAHDHLDLFVCPHCAHELEEAVVLYRGDFLSDFYLGDSNAFEAWAEARRAYFRHRVLDALGILATMAMDARDYAAAQMYAERELEIDDLRENAYRSLMEALARSGRREQALAVYERCRRVLADELGMAPAARTTDYYQKILAGDLRFDRSSLQATRGYELREEIGEGAYGVVYRAVQPPILRQVAVKVIRRQYADDPEFIRRFEAEAKTIARLEHPFIVPLYDYWRDPRGAYLVMRYMEGGSLLANLQGGPWDALRASSMVEQVAAALSVAHRQEIVHRDIKPGNILLDLDGNAYLADFGIAKDLSGVTHVTTANAGRDTLDYKSPEQITGGAVTPRSDIYSLGAVLYETLTGERPFGNAPATKLLYSQVHESLPLVAATRPDVPADVDHVLQKATAKKPGDRYATVLEMATAFIHAARGPVVARPHEGADLRVPPVHAGEIVNPYKGLRPFREADASDFFGRDELVQQLVNRLKETGDGRATRFLAIVGPSGSGKSSVVKAGLLPALRSGALPGSENWFIAQMVPGPRPLEELELALWPIAVDPPPSLIPPMVRDTRGLLRTIRRILPDGGTTPQLLLVIDQFEELFTLTADEERRSFFLASLLAAIQAPRSPLRVVATLRADFYDRPLLHQEWGRLLKENTEVVLPLNHSELTWAIREPARRAGVHLEEELVATIVGDVADQPGALPLLQYALTELFERRNGTLIAQAAYREIDGVQGALGRRAEALYTALDEAGQEAVRQLFLRLVMLGEGVEDTRRRVLRADATGLAAAQQTMDDVLERFGQARLLTFDRDPLTRAPTVEVAHEALLREWTRLRHWLQQSRDDVRLQRVLSRSAAEWVKAGRDASYLLHGARLDQFGEWTEATQLALTPDEKAFLAASLDARTARREAEDTRRLQALQAARDLAGEQQKRAEEQARAAQRLRRRAIYLATALAIATILAVLTLAANRQSTRNAAAARANANAAATNAAASAANAALAQTRGAEEAFQRLAAQEAQADAEAAEIIAEQERTVAQAQAKLATSRELALASFNNLELDPELSMLLALQALTTTDTREAEEALHRALQASRLQLAWKAHDAYVSGMTYSPDGTRLATLDGSGLVRTWDAQSGTLVAEFRPAHNVDAGYPSLIYDDSGRHLVSLTTDVSREYLYLTSWDTRSGEAALTHTLPITTDDWSAYAVSPDWTLVAVGYESGAAAVWEVESGHKLVDLPPLDGWAWRTEFSPDGSRLAVATDRGMVAVWDVANLLASAGVAEPRPQHAFVPRVDDTLVEVKFDNDAARMVLSFLRGIEIWTLSAPPARLLTPEEKSVTIDILAINPDQSLLAGTSLHVFVYVWDLESGELLYRLGGHDATPSQVAFSPDGHSVATADADGNVRVWDARPVAGGEVRSFATGRRITDVELSPDEQLLAIGNLDGPATVWDAQSGALRLTLPGADNTAVYRTAIRPDGTQIATVGEDNVIRIWSTDTGELQKAWTGHGEGQSGGLFFGTIDVTYSPDGSRLATAGTDGVAKVWDADSGEELLALVGHTAGLHSITYSPDGRYIATSSDQGDSSVRVWNAQTGAAIYTLPAQQARAWGLAFSPDSRWLATGGTDGLVNVWDMTTGEERYTLPSQVSSTFTVRFTPDGKKLITGGGDAVRVWDAATGAELQTISTTTGRFDLTGDGRYIYLASGDDGGVRVLALNLGDAIALARARLTRSLTTAECRVYLHVNICP